MIGCQEMDAIASVFCCVVLVKGLKDISSFQMSLWATYRLGGPALKNYKASNFDVSQTSCHFPFFLGCIAYKIILNSCNIRNHFKCCLFYSRMVCQISKLDSARRCHVGGLKSPDREMICS